MMNLLRPTSLRQCSIPVMNCLSASMASLAKMGRELRPKPATEPHLIRAHHVFLYYTRTDFMPLVKIRPIYFSVL